MNIIYRSMVGQTNIEIGGSVKKASDIFEKTRFTKTPSYHQRECNFGDSTAYVLEAYIQDLLQLLDTDMIRLNIGSGNVTQQQTVSKSMSRMESLSKILFKCLRIND